MKYFDASAWVGRWPFAFCAAHTAATLEEELRAHGIARALTSPLDAVFAPEPGPANRELLHATRATPRLVPVPVINPVLANWRAELDACVADDRVRAVRVLPNYHAFRLSGRAMAALVDELRERKIRLVVQMRLIDERHEFHAMNLKGVPAKELAALLQERRDLPVLAGGLLRPDVLALAPQFPRLLCDLAFAEWHDTLPHLLAKVPAAQLVFASHTPLLMPAASKAKVSTAAVSAPVRRAVAGANLEHFLR